MSFIKFKFILQGIMWVLKLTQSFKQLLLSRCHLPVITYRTPLMTHNSFVTHDNLFYLNLSFLWAFQVSQWLQKKKKPCIAEEMSLIPGSGRSPGEGNGNPPSILPWKIHGQRSLAGYSSLGLKESDTTEWLNNNNMRYSLFPCREHYFCP